MEGGRTFWVRLGPFLPPRGSGYNLIFSLGPRGKKLDSEQILKEAAQPSELRGAVHD